MCAHSDTYGTQSQRSQSGEGEAATQKFTQHSAENAQHQPTDDGNKKREKIQQILFH